VAENLSSPETVPAGVPLKRAAVRAHRSGAWKVAYADFVTAMMALFIVLWMMNSTAKIRESVQGYFRDPKGYKLRTGTVVGNLGESLTLDHRTLRDLQKQIEAALRRMPEFKHVQRNLLFTVTAEGLRIDLLETQEGTFFNSGSPTPTTAGKDLIKILAEELVKMPNKIVIEGHTDSRPFRMATATSGYSNWELAADRANATRRLLYTDGVRLGQIVEMRSFADQMPLNGVDPSDPRNRRVSIVVKTDQDRAGEP
jgi:chemotaxis protein MotB